MLFINDVSKSVEEFVSEISRITKKEIDLGDLKKNPSFLRNDAFKAFNLAVYKTTGNKTPNVNQGDDVFASFRYFDGNEQYVFRYANNVPYRNRDKGDRLVYTPKAIDLPDDDFSFDDKNSFDQAVYIYCHPACSDSPFYDPEKVARFSHNSLTKAVKRKSSKLTKLEDCLRYADNLAESEVKIFAKGLGLTLNEHWTTDDIRVELKDYALTYTDTFYNASQLETVKFDGMIQDAIDNKNIVSVNIVDTVVWNWGSGIYKGIQITSVPRGVGDTVLYLKNHIKENIAQYDEILVNLNKSSYANLKSEEYLRAKKSGVVPATEYQSDADEMKLSEVVDFKSAGEFLILTHPLQKQSSQKNTKAFLERVLSGDINDDNVSEEIVQYLAKSE